MAGGLYSGMSERCNVSQCDTDAHWWKWVWQACRRTGTWNGRLLLVAKGLFLGLRRHPLWGWRMQLNTFTPYGIHWIIQGFELRLFHQLLWNIHRFGDLLKCQKYWIRPPILFFYHIYMPFNKTAKTVVRTVRSQSTFKADSSLLAFHPPLLGNDSINTSSDRRSSKDPGQHRA